MKKNICFGLVLLLLAGCSVHTSNYNNNVRREEIVFERPSPPPAWVDKTPEATSEYHYFVGMSYPAATEKKARNDAYKDSINKFATYCGVNVKILYNYLAVSHRLSSEINDPVISSSEYQNHLVEALVGRSRFAAEKNQK